MKKTAIILIVLLSGFTLCAQQIASYSLTSGGLNTDRLKSTAAELIAGRYDASGGSLIYGFNYSFSYNQSTIIPGIQGLGIIFTNRRITLDRVYEQVSIINLKGQTIMTARNVKIIPLEKLPQGIYLLKTSDIGGSHVYKFVHY